MKFCHLFGNGFPRQFSSFNFTNIVQSSGFLSESHKVVTEDGYILTLHRLHPGKHNTNVFNKVPVLLQHGLWSSSEDWILSGPSKSIGHLLAEAGVDVWLGNTRGNHYSREHVEYSAFKNSKEYWNFSWHEMGKFDLPAMITYILKSTSRKYLYYIGHSQGTTSFFVLGATNPELSHNIKAMFGLAPVVYLRNMRNDKLLNLATYQQPLFALLSSTGFHKFVPQERFLSYLEKMWEEDFDKRSAIILKGLSYYATSEVKQNLKNILLSHVSCGTSFKLLAHFAQCTIEGKKFSQFDYGPIRNLCVYGTRAAPMYDIKNISVPMILFHSNSDWLTHPKDVSSLIDELHSNVIVEKVNYQKFNHLDFLWSDFRQFDIYDKLIEYLHYYENN